MSKLSVIICVYNTDECIFEKCIKSVFESTIKNLEVIVIDDGSSKDYSSIVKNFNVKYLKTENQGTLKARLLGVKQSKGDYVCFVDSDDFISFNYFQAGLTAIKDADIVLNDWAFNTQRSKYVCINDSSINSSFVENFPLNRFFNKQGKEHSYYVLWNKIFKRNILLSACEEIEKLNFDKLVYAEDVLINYFCFKLARKIINTHLGYYFYNLHDNQQIVVQTKEKLTNQIDSICLVFNEIEKDLKINKLYKKHEADLHAWKQFACSAMFSAAKRFKSKEVNEHIFEKFKNCKLKSLSNSNDVSYSKHKLLPNNIEEIDRILCEIWSTDRKLKVFAKKHSYAHDSLKKMKDMFGIDVDFVLKKQADIIMPKEKISFKQKILHNNLFCKIGMFLFPIGSIFRTLIKKKL